MEDMQNKNTKAMEDMQKKTSQDIKDSEVRLAMAFALALQEHEGREDRRMYKASIATIKASGCLAKEKEKKRVDKGKRNQGNNE
jgi:hypothetical protein